VARRKQGQGGGRRPGPRQRPDGGAAAGALRADQTAASPPAAAPARLPWSWLGGIALLAFAVRAWIATQLYETALFQRPQLDSWEFLVWAKDIAGGELFRWLATSHGPGYAYFLALLLKLGGGSLLAVSVLQGALGSAVCALVAVLGARAFDDRRAGLAAGVLLALYGPLVYIELSLFAEGFFIFLLVLGLWVLTGSRPPGDQTAGWALAAGLAIGLAAVTRATALPLLPLAAGIVLLGRTPWPRRAAVWMLLGWLAVVVPVIALVRVSSGDWLPVQSFGGLNFYMGNHTGASGTPEARLGSGWDVLFHEPERHGVSGDAARERYFMSKARRDIAAEPLAFVAGLGRKALWLLQADEIRDMVNFFRQQVPALAWLPGFGLLLPLAVWGGWLARRRLSPFLWLYLALFVFSNIAIVMAARYRIPLVPVLAVLAGGAVVWLGERLRRARLRELAPAVAVLLAVTVVTRLREHAPSHDFSEEWGLTAASLVLLERYDEAEDAVERALAENPGWAHALVQRANLRLRAGDAAGAEEALRAAVAVSPDYQQARLGLGMALARRQDLAGAERELRHALSVIPGDARVLAELGQVLLASGKVEEAGSIYRQLVEKEPQRADAWIALARIEGAARRPAAGAALAAKATAAAPDRADAWILLAMLSLDAGDAAQAERALAAAEKLTGPDAPHIALGRALLDRLQGRPESADRRLRDALQRYPGFAEAAQLLLANAAEQGRRAEAEAFLAGLRAGRS
jgi:tetratricopeptide (TPR) repeat protein